jgi:hypothetical protein
MAMNHSFMACRNELNLSFLMTMMFLLKLTKKMHAVVVFLNPFKMTGRLGFGGRREYNPRRRTESEFRAVA